MYSYPQENEGIADSIIQFSNKVLNHPKKQIDSILYYSEKYLKIKPKVSINLAKHALEMSQREGYDVGTAMASYYIGSALAYEKYDVALEHLMEALRLADMVKDQSFQANVRLSIGLVYSGMGQNTKALNEAYLALTIGEKFNDLKLLSRVHTNIASYLYLSGETSLALKHSSKALNLKREIKDSYGIRLNHLNFGIMLCESDTTIDEGLNHLRMARILSESDPMMVNDIITNMIWAHSQKGEYQISLNYLDSALMGNDTIDNLYTREAIHRLGKEIHLELGDFENAYLHSAKEYEIDKELRGNEVNGRFKILELENENNLKQKQILSLEKKRSEATLKLLYAIIIAVIILIVLGILLHNYRIKKQLLDGLRIKQNEIVEKSHQLEIKNKEIEQFAYVASHDLKAPLNTIISIINLLSSEIENKLDAQASQMASFIITSSNRMKSMIDSLLEHGRLGSNITFQEVDLNKLLNDLRNDLQHLITESGAQIEVNYLPKVKGAPIELGLLFQNLITNAVKFSSKDQSPKISISYKSVKQSMRYQISIKDNGVGIPKGRQGSVFNLFERAHGREFEGNGIGLAHCEKIVKLHQGSIWFDSSEGKGTTFHFLLPMKEWSNS